MKVVIFLLASLLTGLARSLECKGKPDGFYEISCLTMAKCINGKLERIICPLGEFVDTDVHQCKPMEKVKPPCGKRMDCSNKIDGPYPDSDQQCKSYYTCVGGHFVGHNFCPASLIFNEELRLCDFKGNVLKPCGNKVIE